MVLIRNTQQGENANKLTISIKLDTYLPTANNSYYLRNLKDPLTISKLDLYLFLYLQDTCTS